MFDKMISKNLSYLFPLLICWGQALANDFHVTHVSPEPHATSAYVNANVSVTFNKQISRATVNDNSFLVFGDRSGRMPGSITFDEAANTATFHPQNPFVVGDRILVVLNHSIQSADGESLEFGYTWFFDVQIPRGGTEFLMHQTIFQMELTAAASADFNKDGITDIVISGKQNSQFVVKILYVQQGQNLVEGPSVTVPYRVRPIYVSDFNGDGNPDLLLLYRYSGFFSLCFLNEQNQLELGPLYSFGLPGVEPRAAFISDMNADGAIDAVILNRVKQLDTVFQFDTSELTTATVNQSYNATIHLKNGVQPYSMNIINGSLPSGLNLDNLTGVINGIPDSVGLFNFAIKAQDSNLPPATIVGNYSIDVVASPLVNEEFSSGSLDGFTQYLPVAGPEFRLDQRPGYLRMTVPSKNKYDHWIDTDFAPQLRRDLESGDWEAEAHCELVSYSSTIFHTGIMVYFSRYNIIYYGFRGDPTLIRISQTSAGNIQDLAYDGGRSICLRVRKIDHSLYFEYHKPDNDEWQLLKKVDMETNPTKVGIMCKTWSNVKVITDFDYFRLRNDHLRIISQNLPIGQIGHPYSTQVFAQNGYPPFRWSVSKGDLPDGLVLDSQTGEIRGTPRMSGTFQFHISVSDNASPENQDEQTIKIRINPVNDKVIFVYLNDGLGNLGENPEGVASFWMTNRAETIFGRDFNNDGLIDIGATRSGPGGGLFLFMNPGDGLSFTDTPQKAYSIVADFENVIAADLTRNQLPDIAAADLSSNKLYFYQHQGVSNNVPEYASPVTYNASSDPMSLRYGDMNADGNLDLITIGRSGDLTILQNNGSGDFSKSSHFAVSNAPQTVATGDFNNDLTLDCFVIDSTGTTTLLLNRSLQNTAPEAPQLSAPANGQYLNSTNMRFTWKVPRDADLDPLHFIATFSGGAVQVQSVQYDSRVNPELFQPAPPYAQGVTSITLTVPPLSEGSYSWSVTAWDGLASSPASQSRDFIADTSPPSAMKFVFPEAVFDRQWFAAFSKPLLVRLNFTEPNPDSAILQVQNVPLPMIKTGFSNAIPLDFSISDFFPQGRYDVQATIVDKAGNRTTQTDWFAVDTAPPTATVAAVDQDTSSSSSFQVSWSGGNDNNGSGLKGSYQVKVKIDNESWTIWKDTVTLTNQIYAGAHQHAYSFEAGSYDNVGNLEVFRGIAEARVWVDTLLNDTTPPGPPVNLQANGANPSPWNPQNTYSLHWENPFDANGIASCFWKIGSAPASNSDFNGSAPVTESVAIQLPEEGEIPVYLWLSDRRGNVDFTRYSSVICRWDKTLPVIQNIQFMDPEPRFSGNGHSWYNSSASGDSAFTLRVTYLERHADSAIVDSDGLAGTLGLDGIAAGDVVDSVDFRIPIHLKNGLYTLKVTVLDSASNRATQDVIIGVDSAAPVNCVASAADTVSVSKVFAVSWSAGSDGTGSGISGAYDVWVKINSGIWGIWRSDVRVRTDDYTGIHGNRYTFEAVSKDNVGNSESLSGLGEISVRVDTSFGDVTPPASPLHLTAGGQEGQSPWQSESVFLLNWSNPDDISGIAGCRYKLESAPVSTNDFIGTGPAIGPFPVDIGTKATVWLYLWLVDGHGNVDYHNYTKILLRHDTDAPRITAMGFLEPLPTLIDGRGVNWYNQTIARKYTVRVAYDEVLVDSLYIAISKLNKKWIFPNPPVGDGVSIEIVLPFEELRDGRFDVTAWIKDKSDRSASKSLRLGLDSTPPSNCVAYVPDTSLTTSFKVTWSAGVDTGCGLSGNYDVNFAENNIWQAWLSHTKSLSSTFQGENLKTYEFEATTSDLLGNASPFLGIAEAVVHVDIAAVPDTVAPAPPIQLKANAASPSPWNKTDVFQISWENPKDKSGILKSYLKLGSPPVSNSDFLRSDSAMGPIQVNASEQDGQQFHLWLEDGQNNVDFHHYASVLLRWDNTTPIIDSLSLFETLYQSHWFNPRISNKGKLNIYYSEKNPHSGILDTKNLVNAGLDSNQSPGVFSYELIFSDSADTTFYITATVRDSAGNTDSDSILISFDSTPPYGSIATSPDSAAPGSFMVSWNQTGQDGTGSGISGVFDVYSRIDGGEWTIWQNRVNTTEAFYTGEKDHVYAFEAAAYDHVGNREELAGIPECSTVVSVGFVDITAPAAPVDLRANGTNPSPWQAQRDFSITWSNPPDPSGIAKSYFKLASAPVSPDDTTATGPANSPLLISLLQDGVTTLYVWLADSRGNVDYRNAGAVRLRLDTQKPVIDNASVQNALYAFKWLNPDSAVHAQIKIFYSEDHPATIRLLTGPVTGEITKAFLAQGAGQSVLFEFSIQDIEDGCYQMTAILSDSAQNQSEDTLTVCLDKTAPHSSRASSPSVSRSESFVVAWTNADLGSDGAGSGLSGEYDLLFRKDGGLWYPLITREHKTSWTFYGEFGHEYSFEVAAWDHVGNREAIAGTPECATLVDTVSVDREAPAAPVQLTVKGARPGGWQYSPLFTLTWENPPDPSTIVKALYKLEKPPSADFDTTGTAVVSGRYGNVTVNVINEYGEKIYIWLMDGNGNLHFSNNQSVELKFDAHRPRVTDITPLLPTFQNNYYNQKVTGEIFIRINFSEKYPDILTVKNRYLPELRQGVKFRSDPDSIDVKVNISALNDGIQWFRIVMQDSAGNSSFADSCSIQLDSTPPQIILVQQDTMVVEKNSYPVTAHVFDKNSLQVVQLQYWLGGQRARTLMDMTAIDDSTFGAAIPGSAVTNRGFEYAIIASDGLNPVRNPLGNNSVSMRVRVLGENQKGLVMPQAIISGTGQEFYRMISVPLQVDDANPQAVLEDDLGQYNLKRWRLFDWNSALEIFDEYPNTGALAPGRALWLITSLKQIKISTGTGKSVGTGKPFVIALHKGWNDVGNPFDFQISWQDINVISASDTQKVFGPYTYNKRWFIPTELTEMTPWEGYSFYTELEDASLSVPARESQTIRKAAPWPALVKEDEWICSIQASQGDMQDAANFFGQKENATAALDYGYDYVEPPALWSGVSLYFPHADWGVEEKRYTSDIRSSAMGAVWEMEVQSSDYDEQIRLHFDVLKAAAPSMQILLLDQQNQSVIDIGKTPGYSFWLKPSKKIRTFKIYAGTSDFIAAHQDELETITEFRLVQNFPNPFNHSTVIHFELKENTTIDLSVYNMLGQRVRTLMEGYKEKGVYEYLWNAQDQAGQDVGSGIYILQLQSPHFHASRKMIYMR